MYLHAGTYQLSLERPLIMAVVNITPDSFSDGGRYLPLAAAQRHAERLVEEGADILDLGGESSRPGALPVGESEEIDRVLPVLEALQPLGKPISVDTRKAGVMAAAIRAGAAMINDITALTDPAALAVVADSDAAVCLMHMQGEPQHMQNNPHYDDVVAEVQSYLAARARACRQAGISSQRLVIDPGFGFGKTLPHNLTLLRDLSRFSELGVVLAGLSRKSMLGAITGRAVADRLPASLAAALYAAQQGAKILRVHDVAATRDALLVWQAAASA